MSQVHSVTHAGYIHPLHVGFLPRASIVRERAHSLVCAFHAISCTALGRRTRISAFFRDASVILVAPRGFDQHASRFSVAGLRDPATANGAATGVLGRYEPDIAQRRRGDSKRLKSPVEATKVAADSRSIPRRPRKASTSGPRDHSATIAVMRFIRASLLPCAVHTAST